jgi:hypothetical protein
MAMGSHHLSACYPLTEEGIARNVTLTAPGSYALGYVDGGTFIAFYVGRSGSDVSGRLRSWIGVDCGSHLHGPSAKAAYGTRRRNHLPLPCPALGTVGVVDGAYTHFEFIYASCAQGAFEGECRAFHDFGGTYGSLENGRHPAPPQGMSWVCPVHGDHRRTASSSGG